MKLKNAAALAAFSFSESVDCMCGAHAHPCWPSQRGKALIEENIFPECG